MTARVRYGAAIVPASLLSRGILGCLAPPADDAGLARALSLDFDEGLTALGARLVGDAEVHDGMLKLTSAEHLQHGALVIPPPPPWPWRRFELKARVYVRGGELKCDASSYAEAAGRICGGEGFSFSYGTMPAEGLSLLGGNGGLRVAFFTATRDARGPSVEVAVGLTGIRHDPWPMKTPCPRPPVP